MCWSLLVCTKMNYRHATDPEGNIKKQLWLITKNKFHNIWLRIDTKQLCVQIMLSETSTHEIVMIMQVYDMIISYLTIWQIFFI